MWLRQGCVRVGLWLAALGGWAPTISPPTLVNAEVLERAKVLTSTQPAAMGGEAKRHAVYARLIKDFPQHSKRELALAIELALSPKEG